MTFLPIAARVTISDETCVLDVALSNNIDLNHSCGGMGSCGTCRVLVESDLTALSKRTELEQEMAQDRHFTPEERLACQLVPQDGLVVRIPGPTDQSV